jgi:hypothetical protein
MMKRLVQLRARQTLKAPKICFIHVPKCGGSSVARGIAESYSYSERLIVPNWRISLRASQTAATLLGRSMMDVRETVLAYKLAEARAKFVTGHIACRPTTREAFEHEWRFVTVLRDPVSRWISEFVYNTYGAQAWARNTLPLDEYVEAPIGAATARRYIEYFSTWRPGEAVEPHHIDNAVANLKRFAAIGVLEGLQAFAATLERILGRTVRIPQVNASPKRSSAADIMQQANVVARIRQLCAPDIAVYELVTSPGHLLDPTRQRAAGTDSVTSLESRMLSP